MLDFDKGYIIHGVYISWVQKYIDTTFIINYIC